MGEGGGCVAPEVVRARGSAGDWMTALSFPFRERVFTAVGLAAEAFSTKIGH